MFHFLPMILLPPCLIMEGIMTINPNTFPKRLIPSAVRRKAITEQKTAMRIRTITGLIAKIGTIATSTGLGSTANDGNRPLTTGQRSGFCLSETTHPNGNRGRQIILPFSETHHLGRSQWKQRPPKRLRRNAALKNGWPQRGHFQLANQAARKK